MSKRIENGSAVAVSRRALLGVGLAAGGAILPSASAMADSLTKPKSNGNPVLGEGGGLYHVAIRTHDWNRSLAFYEKALGFTVKVAWMGQDPGETSPHHAALLDTGNGRYIELVEDPTFIPPPSDLPPKALPKTPILHHYCLRTARLNAACEHARAMGAKVIFEPMDHILEATTGQGPIPTRLAFLQGPSGEWIELLENAP